MPDSVLIDVGSECDGDHTLVRGRQTLSSAVPQPYAVIGCPVGCPSATLPFAVNRTPTPVRIIPLLALAAAVAGPASAQDIFVAPTRNTIVASSEQSYSSSPAHVLYVSNRSTVPIVVFGLTLSDCENIRQACTGQRINIPVPPGDRRQVGRVDARDAEKAYNYRWGFSYIADSSDAKVMAVLRAHGYSPEGTPLPQPAAVRRVAVDTTPAASGVVAPGSSIESAMDPSIRTILPASAPRDSAPAQKFRFKVQYGSILGSTMMPGAPIQLTGPCINPAESAGYEKDAKIARTPWRPPVLPSLGMVRIPGQYVDSTKKGAEVLVRFAVDTTGEAIPTSASVLDSPYGAISVNACREAIAAKGTPARDKNGNAIRAWVQIPLRAVQ